MIGVQAEFRKKEDLAREFQRALMRAAPLGLDEAINAFADPSLNNYAFEVVVKTGSVAVDPLIGALQNSDRTVQDFAARALAEIKDKRAVAPLLKTIQTDPGAGRHVATALGSFGKEVVDPLLAIADDLAQPEFGRALAIRALAETRDARAVPFLLRMVASKGRLREAASEALDRSDPAVIASVVCQIGDPAFAAKTDVYLIRRGVPSTEGLLVRALNMYGDAEMAEVFLNCGNDELASSARGWAGRHGYGVTHQTVIASGVRWGAAK